MEHYKWMINAFLVAGPISIVTVGLAGFNIYESIWWQKWWADGNWFLIGKSIYIVVQTLCSLPLIFEIDVYLRHAKTLRFLVMNLAIFYTLFYVVVGGVWYWEIYHPPAWMDYSVPNLFFRLAIGYNLVFDLLPMVANIVIIAKEIFLEFFSLTKASGKTDEIEEGGADDSDLALHFVDQIDGLVNLAFILNPLNILVFIWKIIVGKVDWMDPEATIESS